MRIILGFGFLVLGWMKVYNHDLTAGVADNYPGVMNDPLVAMFAAGTDPSLRRETWVVSFGMAEVLSGFMLMTGIFTRFWACMMLWVFTKLMLIDFGWDEIPHIYPIGALLAVLTSNDLRTEFDVVQKTERAMRGASAAPAVRAGGGVLGRHRRRRDLPHPLGPHLLRPRDAETMTRFRQATRTQIDRHDRRLAGRAAGHRLRQEPAPAGGGRACPPRRPAGRRSASGSTTSAARAAWARCATRWPRCPGSTPARSIRGSSVISREQADEHPTPQSDYGGWVDVGVTNIAAIDFVEIDRALRDEGHGGLAHRVRRTRSTSAWRRRSGTSAAACAGTPPTASPALDRARTRLRWVDSVTADRASQA